MKELKHIVRDYIQQPSGVNYALMINGSWGSGKTHFVLNELKDSLIEASTEDGGCGKELIYVSLNGLGSPEEIFGELLSTRFPLGKLATKNTIGKLFFGMVKSVSVAGLGLLLPGLKSPFSKIKNKDIIDAVSFNNDKHVLCFDDLERISPSFAITDVLGFINRSFVEYEGLKVIIIADESKIGLNRNTKEEISKGKADYLLAKEKVIGRTISFDPDLNDLGEALLTEVIQREQLVLHGKEFLNSNKKFILRRIVKVGNKNLRTIQFFLDNLVKVVSSIDTELLGSFMQELVNAILIFSYEEKDGALNRYNEIDELPIVFTSDSATVWTFAETKYGDSSIFEGRNREEEGIIYQEIVRKYIKNEKYIFLPSIFKLIKTGLLHEQDLARSLKAFQESIESEEEKTLYRVLGFDRLNDVQLEEELSKLKHFLQEGKYSLVNLVDAVWAIYNLLDLELITEPSKDVLKKWLEKGIEPAKHIDQAGDKLLRNRQHIPQSFQLLQNEAVFVPQIEQISNLLNKKRFKDSANKAYQNLIDIKCPNLMPNEFGDLLKALDQDQINSIVDKLIEQSPMHLERLIDNLRNLFKPAQGYVNKPSPKEEEILIGLRNHGEQKKEALLSDTGSKVASHFWLKLLSKTLEEILAMKD